MMQRFMVNLGTRGGFIKKCITKDRMIRFVTFSASNAEKESLYKLYEEIEKLIIQKLAILTSTGKTFIALIDEEKRQCERIWKPVYDEYRRINFRLKNQTTIFDFISTKLKVLELFGGIGACTAVLKRLGIDFEVADYVEIDKYAVASYNAINKTNFEPQDITKWDKDIEVDLIMSGSPCQD